MKYSITLFSLIGLLFNETVAADGADTLMQHSNKQAVMTFNMNDGSDLTGRIVSENDSIYVVDLSTGFQANIPKTSVLHLAEFKGRIVNGKIYGPDPNRSRYLYTVTAFPVGKEEAYCSDFCLVFPSYNFGVTEHISAQVGAMYFPGLTLESMPFYAGAKISLPTVGPFTTAGGVQYFTIPGFFDKSERFGMGFLFTTATLGDHFDHFSVSLGWGFMEFERETEIMDRPIVILAGNKRISSTLALVSENWIIPDSDVGQIPMALAVRFIGKRIAVDIGGIIALSMLEDGVLPIPLISFAYHR
jgi:hypothetical protein